ncbi:MAG: MerR family transcriptional regulator [Microlunatus sp.]|nr:MerR family transcriptional regulator [Microlunatus sp.]
MPDVGPEHPVFGIAVAAELAGTGPQNLRAYERAGLISPARTPGGTRRYSHADVDRLRRVIALMDEGLNLAGVAMVLDLQDENHRLDQQLNDPPAD